MNETKRVALYARVSTGEQSVLSQLHDLREYCTLRRWQIVGEFQDEGISGSVDDRPGVRECKAFAMRGKADVVLVWAFDRFARSTQHLLRVLEELRTVQVDFVSYQQNIDTTTPTGKMVFTFLAAIAEFERSLIRERVLMGQRRAKSEGVAFGRRGWKTRPGFLAPEKIAEVLALRGRQSQRQIAVATGLGKVELGFVY